MGHRVWFERLFIGGLAPASVFGSRFAANIILSRLLAPEEFGVAVAMNVVLGLGWLVTDVALDRFVMIAERQRALATAHLLAIINSGLLALLLAVGAPAFAVIFGVPEFVESFRSLALVALINGFAHYGIKQIQRNYNYGPFAIAQVSSNIAALGALFAVALTIRDHRAILASLTVQVSLYVVLSHFLAGPAYRLAYDKRMLRRALSFGLPLTLNGIGLAVMSQFDRVLVGYWFGVSQLASYTVMVSMSLVPANLVGSVLNAPSFSFLLPESSDPGARDNRYTLLLACYSVVTALYACWIALTLDVLVPLVFGPAFRVSSGAHVLLVLIACFRMLRSGPPTTLLLATGRTKQLAGLNLSSGIGLLAAAFGVMVSPSLETMLLGIAVGDFISCVIFFASVWKVAAAPSSLSGDLLSALIVPAIMAFALSLNSAPTWAARGILLGVGCVAVSVHLYFEVVRNERLREIVLELTANRFVKRSVRPTKM